MREYWIEVELGDICETSSGGTPSRSDASNYLGSIPWVKSGELRSNVIEETEEHISETALKNSSAKVFPKGSLLIALYGATIGKSAFLGIDAATNQAVCAIFENDIIQSKFLYHYLFHKKSKLVEQGAGGAQPNISQTILKRLPIPLPPLPEQRAIVYKIEQLFSELDNGITNLKTSQQQLKVYRQALLKKVFENIKKKMPLGEMGDWAGGGTPNTSTKEYWDGGNIPWVSSKDVKVKDLFDTSRHITELAIENSSTKWIPEDALIFVMRSGILRRLFPISVARVPMCVNQDILTVSLNSEYDRDYVFWYLTGKESTIRNECSKDGTTVESVDAAKLKSFLVPVCSPKKQKQIVQEIESRLSVCEKVEESITQSLQKAEALRQSILKKAFEGRLLTEQELAACKKEKDWESAGVLLKRIKAENK